MKRKSAYVVAVIGVILAIVVAASSPERLLFGLGMLFAMITLIALVFCWPKSILKIFAPELSGWDIEKIIQGRDPLLGSAPNYSSSSFSSPVETALKHVALKRGTVKII